MGDPIRESAFPGYLDSFAPQFFNFNRGKRSIQLDLRREGAKEIIFRMVKSADVVLENFKVGTMDRLGIGYDVLKEQNPDIIYASASGFGLQGPWVRRICASALLSSDDTALSTEGPRQLRHDLPGGVRRGRLAGRRPLPAPCPRRHQRQLRHHVRRHV